MRNYLDSKKIKKLYEEDLIGAKEISNIFKCSLNLIYKLLKENGVEINMVKRRKLLFKEGKLKPNFWNKGLTKETDERVKRNAESISKSLMGNKLSKEHIEKISRTRNSIEWKKTKGKKMAEKISESLKKTYKEHPEIIEQQKKSLQKTYKEHPEKREKASKLKIKYYQEHPETIEKIKIARAKQVFPIKDTSIEIKMQKLLSLFHIEFYTHKYISEITHSYQCDIFVPVQKGISQKTIIEADGCYWHGCLICNYKPYKKLKERKELDRLRTQELLKKGFRVLRLWGHEIKEMSIKEFENRILK